MEANEQGIPNSTAEKPRYKIIFKRDVCIGALPCAASAPEFWIKSDDGKVDLKGAKKIDENTYELEVVTLGRNHDAAVSCPVNAIKVIDLWTGQEII